MSDHLSRVTLRGALARHFGAEHEFVLTCPKDAIAALEANCPGFRAYVHQLSERGIAYKFVTDRHTDGLVEDQLEEAMHIRSLEICPVVSGSGAVGRIIAGAAILAVGVAVPFASVAGGLSLSLLGASVLLGGIQQFISPQTKAKDTKETKSSSFDSALGFSDRSVPIPLLYGRMRVSGMPVLSSGLDTEIIP